MELIGIDTGGTFTDFLRVRAGEISVRKRPGTPADPARVILDTIRESAAGLAGNAAPARVVHGSTVATNALLERRGARTALVVTRGFADVVEIGRQDRPRIYDLQWRPPVPLVPGELRFEVDERMGPGGAVLRAPDPEQLAALSDRIADSGAEAVAVCCLFSAENDAHERQIAAALAPLGIPVIGSAHVHPEIREYERFSTAAISAYVAPVMESYLQRLATALAPAQLYVMESAGGVVPWSRLAGHAVRTVLSGPAGGVVAAATLASSDASGLVSFDMGGTSTDVALVPRGQPICTHDLRMDGLPVAVPVLDVHTVGAGGGSQAWIDAGGALRVGPRSSGADPGPACYGHGGQVATVTDAHMLLGHLRDGLRLGGELAVDRAPADAAFAHLAGQLGCDPLTAARGVVQVVEAEMERALRRITQERGVDPRQLTLVSYGGAGGLHAVALARGLGMPQVLVPPDPGIFSARGTLLAPTTEHAAHAVVARLDGALLARLGVEAREREAPLVERLHRETVGGEVELARELALRYEGQSHELDIPWLDDDPGAAFHAAYRARFGSADPDRPLEVVAVRSRAWRAPPPLPAFRAHAENESAAPERVPVFLDSEAVATDVPCVQRDALDPAQPLAGPAIVEELSGTLWLPRGATATLRDDGCLLIAVGRAAR